MKRIRIIYLLLMFFVFMVVACFPQPEFDEEYAGKRLNAVGYKSPDWWATLDSIINEYPTEAWANYRKGLALIRDDNYIEGISYLEKSAELDPYRYANYTGVIKLDLGDYEGAIEHFKTSIRLKNHIDIIVQGSAYERMALAYKEMENYEKAIETFDTYINKFGEDDVYLYTFMHRGIAKVETGDLEGAMADFDTIIRKWDKCPEAYYQKGLLYHHKGDNVLACKQFKKSLLYKNYIRSNPSSAYIDQLYLSDIERMFDVCCGK